MTHRQGFTLIEILIALAIVAVLGAVVAPAYMAYVERGKKTATVGSIKTIKMSLNLYEGDTGNYPQRLRDLIKKPAGPDAEGWNGPYLQSKQVPKDGYGKQFVYKRTEGAEHPYELYSYGKRGKGAPKSEWIDAWEL